MIYVTSDLHGCPPEVLQQLLQSAGFSDEDFLFILGDVIDRGNHGIQLLQWLTEQPNVQLILGNHEILLLACAFLFTQDCSTRLTDEQMLLLACWMENGGGTTLTGLVEMLQQDPSVVEGILDYLRDAPLYEMLKVSGRYFVLVHGGLGNFDPGRPLDDYGLHELTEVRPSLTDRYYSDATVIFGHTPTVLYGPEYEGRALHTDTWICIDTGAAMGRSPMLLRLDDMKEFYV